MRTRTGAADRMNQADLVGCSRSADAQVFDET
jgi:hypothetical protein